MGFSSFCLWQAGEHAVRWSQPVGARIARPIGAFRLKGQRMCPRFTGRNAACAAASRTRGGQFGAPSRRALRCGSSERYAHCFGVAANPLPVAMATGWQMEGVTYSCARSAP